MTGPAVPRTRTAAIAHALLAVVALIITAPVRAADADAKPPAAAPTDPPHPAAASPAPNPATEFAGLFIQSCLSYAGDAAALRAWATRTGLPAVPDPARAAFLHGAPGQAFDASSDAGKFVLVSSDDGLCSVVAQSSRPQPAIDALEGDLRQSGITFRLVIERDDAAIPEIHDREYLATRNGRSWRILLATVKDEAGGQAMLTAAPE